MRDRAGSHQTHESPSKGRGRAVGVQVAVRLRRPVTIAEKQQSSEPIYADVVQNSMILTDRGHRYEFPYDNVFGPDVDQEAIFSSSVEPLIAHFLNGFNATVLAYGCTNAGKTYTLGTSLVTSRIGYSEAGIVPRAMEHIFKERAAKMEFTVSFIEIYNRSVIDLLSHNSSSEIAARFTANHVSMPTLTVEPVKSAEEAIAYLQQGITERRIRETEANPQSSRSHAIFMVRMVHKGYTSSFFFCDLAGSESQKKAKTKGQGFREHVAINQGLSVLNACIRALAAKKKHIPFREHTLTMMLRESLGGNSQTLMLVCVSPAHDVIRQSLITLKHGRRARSVTNRLIRVKAQPPEDPGKRLENAYNEIRRLRCEQVEAAFTKDGIDIRESMVLDYLGEHFPTLMSKKDREEEKKKAKERPSFNIYKRDMLSLIQQVEMEKLDDGKFIRKDPGANFAVQVDLTGAGQTQIAASFESSPNQKSIVVDSDNDELQWEDKMMSLHFKVAPMLRNDKSDAVILDTMVPRQRTDSLSGELKSFEDRNVIKNDDVLLAFNDVAVPDESRTYRDHFFDEGKRRLRSVFANELKEAGRFTTSSFAYVRGSFYEFIKRLGIGTGDAMRELREQKVMFNANMAKKLAVGRSRCEVFERKMEQYKHDPNGEKSQQYRSKYEKAHKLFIQFSDDVSQELEGFDIQIDMFNKLHDGCKATQELIAQMGLKQFTFSQFFNRLVGQMTFIGRTIAIYSEVLKRQRGEEVDDTDVVDVKVSELLMQSQSENEMLVEKYKEEMKGLRACLKFCLNDDPVLLNIAGYLMDQLEALHKYLSRSNSLMLSVTKYKQQVHEQSFSIEGLQRRLDDQAVTVRKLNNDKRTMQATVEKMEMRMQHSADSSTKFEELREKYEELRDNYEELRAKYDRQSQTLSLKSRALLDLATDFARSTNITPRTISVPLARIEE
ncbi:hypothetical protein PCE1_003609 [Barthelona sp. PCE]